LIADHQKAKVTAKELQRLEKQRKLAQTLRLKADAEENGEDLERKKAWEWSIEQNDRWEAKKAEQAIRGDTNFHGEFTVPCMCVCDGLTVYWACGPSFVTLGLGQSGGMDGWTDVTVLQS